ncbi:MULTISPECIES: lysylphosphatidylglycerol synthase transmembrane domain-containing protein [Ramlibacter]|uniref:UPF0104 family protein n=1 Tax=Ramlibacter pinisoli TaxID=2682844 RepID=A0A6N8ITH0_9BURK|nr:MULTISPECIES: lysylphosphatidylglycerol synthase transmembrane domain-containing protein [Ramlibacter]MBA2964504.1 flippase-like domain-containing protein [Ramlibacter sp. CGMCC 1.13660]MVQ29470.1 UPF0104 family protein [Ramlibacter pinisoli]
MTGGRIRLVVGLAVAATALVLLLRGIDGPALWQAASHLSAGGLLLAAGLLAAGYALRVLRWWWMLAAFDRRLRLRDCVTPYVASIALNNVLPLRAGDAVRAFGFRQRLGLPAATVLGSVVLERLLDLALLLALFFAGAWAAPAGTLPAGLARGAGVVAAAALVLLVLLPVLGPPVARRLGRQGGPAPAAGVGLLRQGAARLLDSFALLRSPGRALVLLPLTLAVWACEGAVFATIAADLASHTPPWAAWFAMATGTLATLLPGTPGYVGTFDWFASLGLAAFGAPREVAVAFALAAHAVLWAPVTAAGLALLAWQGGASALRSDRHATAP